MITGIGLDITELDRIARLDSKSEKFRNRILTTEEHRHYQQLSSQRRTEFLAGRFAAKEAYAKALGTGIGPDCSFLDIAILPNEKGAPILYFNNQPVDGFVSITHTQTVAAAQVILQKTERI
ncbi:holo-ACP synthase [Sporosarcina sp. A2]|uniref:holo-ACP synthase n=1 Tax=Sporosarcina sp. A2 TaxID=3393449 RepID=UPI003D79141D